jgi:tRNA pseudouridine32 synthase/23S rRNA pseudouridine746 synthase
LPLFSPLALQPPPGALPARLPDPFAPGPPHPLARQAAELLRREIAGLPSPLRDDLARGKMMGVLVARDTDGRVGVLRAFAGMLAGRWDVEGFVGPIFDLVDRNALWPAAERELRDYAVALAELATGPRTTALRAELAVLAERHATAARALKARHEVQRMERRAEREAILVAPSGAAEMSAALSRLSRRSRDDRIEGRQQRAAQATEREGVQSALRAGEREQAAIKRHRARRSCEVLERMLSGYQIPSARGEVRPVCALFAPHAPPGGAGDCAGPKLFAHAQRERLQPLALAEFWWGAPAKGGQQHPGVYYPSCRRKCGPVLKHMLQGWTVDGEERADDPRVSSASVP